MQLLYFVEKRLKFVSYFYESTSALLEETKRKIEAEEPPYVDTRDPEFADEPAFLEEWEHADAALNLTGAACLGLLQSTLHSFLHEYMKEIGQGHSIPHLHEMHKGSWFGNYRALFFHILGIDWGNSGADIDLLEQVILTRNDFTHNLDFTSLNAYRTTDHSKKYPNSAFTDPRWQSLVFYRERLLVARETLDKATDALHGLCQFLERERPELIRRLRTARTKGPEAG